MSAATIADETVPQDLLDRAMQLHTASRGKLGQLLLASVTEANAARDLIHSRIAQLVGGEVELRDADELIEELERRYGVENPS